LKTVTIYKEAELQTQTTNSSVSLTDCALKSAAAFILIKTWDKSVKAKKNKDVSYCFGNTHVRCASNNQIFAYCPIISRTYTQSEAKPTSWKIVLEHV